MAQSVRIEIDSVEGFLKFGEHVRELSKNIAKSLAQELKAEIEDGMRDLGAEEDPNRKKKLVAEETIEPRMTSVMTDAGEVIYVRVSKSVTKMYIAAPQPSATYEISMFDRPRSGEKKVMGIRQKCSTNKYNLVTTDMVEFGTTKSYYLDELDYQRETEDELGQEEGGVTREGEDAVDDDDTGEDQKPVDLIMNLDYDAIAYKILMEGINQFKGVIGAK